MPRRSLKGSTLDNPWVFNADDDLVLLWRGTLKGSTLDNPWVLNADGDLVLLHSCTPTDGAATPAKMASPKKASTPAAVPRKIIHEGPPSLIDQNTRVIKKRPSGTAVTKAGAIDFLRTASRIGLCNDLDCLARARVLDSAPILPPSPRPASVHMAHRKSRGAPKLLIGGTVSSISTHSDDDRRQQMARGEVGQDAGPLTAPRDGSHFWAEDLRTSEARQRSDFTYRLGNDSLEPQVDQEFDDGTRLDDGITVVIKEPRYLNSVRSSASTGDMVQYNVSIYYKYIVHIWALYIASILQPNSPKKAEKHLPAMVTFQCQDLSQ
ncbi:hypothetical protein B0H13DRAFT_1935514 [Mycena leptocephala]|nr:hypothetical protein B0H13DRAFT_1935514 [Mycena leptocephala]